MIKNIDSGKDEWEIKPIFSDAHNIAVHITFYQH